MRALTSAETARLEANGCRCRDWSAITVDESFNAENYHNVRVAGKVTLGRTDGNDRIIGGIPYPPGISDATVCDCHVCDNSYIYYVSGGIAGYDIAPGAAVIGCHRLTFAPGSACGEGITADVLDETGSLPVTLHRTLTAQLAYASLADKHFGQAHNEMARRLAATYTHGTIGHDALVTGCGTIENVNIGSGTVIDGATALHDGTADGCRIGSGVTARDFIAIRDSHLTGHANIRRCFIGANVTLDSLTAHDSLFFANSHLCNGEAAATFAGPFTVSEHKSTLLIGGAFWMFNAGSGTNQSNHLYKLGPEYYGFTGRGTRAGSDSYILWPARIGAFTTVLGRHYGHPDTELFPFSYMVNEPDGSSRLIPGIALERISVERDTRKWPSRDRRSEENRADLVTFHALNPYTVSRLMAGLDMLCQIPAGHDLRQNGFHIAARDIPKGIGRYRDAILRYFGSVTAPGPKLETDIAPTDWVDLGGFVTTRELVNRLGIEILGISDAETLRAALDRFRTESESAASRWRRAIASDMVWSRYGPDGAATMRRDAAAAERARLTALLAEGEAEGQRTGKNFVESDLAATLRDRLAAL